MGSYRKTVSQLIPSHLISQWGQLNSLQTVQSASKSIVSVYIFQRNILPFKTNAAVNWPLSLLPGRQSIESVSQVVNSPEESVNRSVSQ